MNWYGMGDQTVINLDYVVCVDKKDKKQIAVYFSHGPISSKYITFEDEKARDNAFEQMSTQLREWDD